MMPSVESRSQDADCLAAGPKASCVPVEEVRAQLGRILASQPFVTSKRLCRFLRFVVERTLENDSDRLKEFTIALEVFDRDESYDPNTDSVVRVEARRLRAKLNAYYQEEGGGDPVLIGLRPGSYVPLFHALPTSALMIPARPVIADGIQGSSARGINRLTIAVLPFVNMSPEPEQDYFCDGITEETINALTTIEELNVVARTSAFQFKGKTMDIREAGERLGAQVLVEGSVRKAGDQLRITAQAIDAVTGHHVWSETFQRKIEDVFAIQEEISLVIANTLHVRLVQPSSKSRPRTAWLKGMCPSTSVNRSVPVPGAGIVMQNHQFPYGFVVSETTPRECWRLNAQARPVAIEQRVQLDLINKALPTRWSADGVHRQ